MSMQSSLPEVIPLFLLVLSKEPISFFVKIHNKHLDCFSCLRIVFNKKIATVCQTQLLTCHGYFDQNLLFVSFWICVSCFMFVWVILCLDFANIEQRLGRHTRPLSVCFVRAVWHYDSWLHLTSVLFFWSYSECLFSFIFPSFDQLTAQPGFLVNG